MPQNGKPKLAMYWAASCGGCEIAVLNIGDKILDVDANFEIVFWPVAMDAKYHDVEEMEDGEILLTFFNGGIRTDENEHLAKLLRAKSQILVAFGACAIDGGNPGLANFTPAQEILDTVYSTISTENPENIRPSFSYDVQEGTIYIPAFEPVLRTLDQVVDVDYYIPGCPPESNQIAAIIDLVIQVLQGNAELPSKGSAIGVGLSTVCDDCSRTRHIKKLKEFKRIQEMAKIDPVLCLLEQGILCNGPATASGCGAKCPQAGAPCFGCYGSAEGVVDYGGRMISAIASVIDSDSPDEIDRILDAIVDPAGSFYRFNLASSLLRTGKASWNGN